MHWGKYRQLSVGTGRGDKDAAEVRMMAATPFVPDAPLFPGVSSIEPKLKAATLLLAVRGCDSTIMAAGGWREL